MPSIVETARAFRKENKICKCAEITPLASLGDRAGRICGKCGGTIASKPVAASDPPAIQKPIAKPPEPAKEKPGLGRYPTGSIITCRWNGVGWELMLFIKHEADPEFRASNIGIHAGLRELWTKFNAAQEAKP